MTFYIRAWVDESGHMFTLNSDEKPILRDTYEGPCAFAIDADIDGDYMDAGEVMAAVSLDGQKLTGLPFTRQEVRPGVAAPPPPPIEDLRATMQLTRRQVFLGMLDAGLITDAEAIAVATVGTVPSAIMEAIQTLPLAERTPAIMTFGMFKTAYRTDPMVALFQATAGMDDDAMDAFFITYAGV